MREYELIYIIQPDAGDERVQEVHDRAEGAVTGGQGLVLLRDDWGKRKLAYEINKFQKGHYFQLCFLGDGKFIGELERLLRIDPDVLRFLTVLVSEEVVDIDGRIAQAKEQAEEQARRRAERERIEAERERERAEAAAARTPAPEREPEKAPEKEPTSEEKPSGSGEDAPASEE